MPQQAEAHGTEFIMSRMRLVEGGSVVELRLVVDYSGNPLIADEAAAHEALQKALLIKHGEKTTPYADLAPLEFHDESTWAEAVPPSLLPPPDGQEHSLLTGIWRWQPDSPEIAFTVARGNKHDVLIWQQPPEGSVTSVMLLGGDVSPAVVITRHQSSWMKWVWIALPPAVLGLAVVFWKRRAA
ncbi:hypothetical protein BGE01nite_25690 [Brevifollis gellanilyticus]|uniref:Uncharacterized protein n=2 Tax=Brevifollis gellanilyticus TaxID=748831 RepID=A0A512M955_9BACT|nr:hypothetical protein BGE01nite_25690 [Brevifollis gellanilyticus]